jgi:hypothetical protein
MLARNEAKLLHLIRLQHLTFFNYPASFETKL